MDANRPIEVHAMSNHQSIPVSEYGHEKTALAAALRLAERFGYSEGVCNHFSLQVDDDFVALWHHAAVSEGDLRLGTTPRFRAGGVKSHAL